MWLTPGTRPVILPPLYVGLRPTPRLGRSRAPLRPAPLRPTPTRINRALRAPARRRAVRASELAALAAFTLSPRHSTAARRAPIQHLGPWRQVWRRRRRA